MKSYSYRYAVFVTNDYLTGCLPIILTFTSQSAGQIVTFNSYRNPSLVAKTLSTLDIISTARVELGIVAGWYEQQYAYGYEFRLNYHCDLS